MRLFRETAERLSHAGQEEGLRGILTPVPVRGGH